MAQIKERPSLCNADIKTYPERVGDDYDNDSSFLRYSEGVQCIYCLKILVK